MRREWCIDIKNNTLGSSRVYKPDISVMSGIYEEVEIEDMKYDPDTLIYYYPCPCGDKFFITLEDLYDGEDIATCPSCTLRIRVIFDEETLPPLPEIDSSVTL